MSSYPTPPPTSSPKQFNLPLQLNNVQPDGLVSSTTIDTSKASAQDSFFHPYSAPTSPAIHLSHEAALQHQFPPRPPSSYQTAPYTPEYTYDPQQACPPLQQLHIHSPSSTRKSSPARTSPSSRTSKRRTPPLTSQSPRPYSPPRSPRPLYSSPLNPIPTPYNASRPSPRPGLIKRIIRKIQAGLRSFARWAQRNPIMAGVISFIPMIAITGAINAAKKVKDLGEDLGLVGNGGRAAKDDRKKAADVTVGERLIGGKKGMEQLWGWGLDNFCGFGGVQKDAGPLEGIIKVVQMLL